MVEGKTAQHPVAVFLLLFGFGAMSGCECRPAELLFGGQPDSNDLRKESVDGSAADAGRFRKMECKVSYTYDVGWRDRKLIESSPGRFGYEGDGVVASAEIAADKSSARLLLTDQRNGGVTTAKLDTFAEKGFVALHYDNRDRGLAMYLIVNLECSEFFRG